MPCIHHLNDARVYVTSGYKFTLHYNVNDKSVSIEVTRKSDNRHMMTAAFIQNSNKNSNHIATQIWGENGTWISDTHWTYATS